MMRRLCSLLAGLALCLVGLCTHAGSRVVMVSSDNTAAYMDATQALAAELVRGGVSPEDVMRLSVPEWAAQSEPALQARIYVALGTQATVALAGGHVSAPVLAALLPRSSFERALRSNALKASPAFTAIYLDQSLKRQLALIRLALPQAKTVGVLWGPDSWLTASALRVQAVSAGLSLNEAGLDGKLNLFLDLQKVLDDSDVILALADPQVFNSNTIQNILLTTFRAQVPMVAFSPAYVRAGALLALHTTPEQVGRQSAALVLAALRDKPLPALPVPTNDFEVSVNVHVARALNLTLDGQALRQALRQLEHLP